MTDDKAMELINEWLSVGAMSKKWTKQHENTKNLLAKI